MSLTRAYIGLGSNLGDRAGMLDAAAASLDWGDVKVVARSSIYETAPVGGPPEQPNFYNQVIAADTSMDVYALWERCSAVEAALGRARMREERWGPRAIDIDLLLFGDDIVSEPDLLVPHPRMHERAFVLVPLAEIAPDVSVDGLGTAAEACARLDVRDVRKVR